jgi:peptidoglycan/LPS O-acetylase OafA/YrhL
MASQNLKSIQRLRAIAVISVVCYHIWVMGYADNVAVFRYGHWGVQLFFMISGFIMMQKLPTYRNLVHFGRRRLRRLWPPLFVILLLSLPFAFLVAGNGNYEEITTWNYLSSFFMFNPMLLNGVFGTSLNYPFQILWTVSVELSFYFAISIIYFTLGRRYLYLMVGLLLISVLSVSLFCGESSLIFVRGFTLALGLFYFPYFLFGCAVWLILNQIKVRFWEIFLAVFAFLLAVVSAPQPQGELHRFLTLTGIAILFYLMIMGGSTSNNLPYRTLEIIGDLSYEIYLVHGILIFPTLEFFAPPVYFLN